MAKCCERDTDGDGNCPWHPDGVAIDVGTDRRIARRMIRKLGKDQWRYRAGAGRPRRYVLVPRGVSLLDEPGGVITLHGSNEGTLTGQSADQMIVDDPQG